MPQTKLRPDAQVAACYTVTDSLPAGATQAGQAQTLNDDFNLDRSAIARILDATGGTRFFGAVPAAGDGVQRGLTQLTNSQYSLETQPFNTETSVLVNISIPANQNWVILSVANSQAPNVAAATVSPSFGAICGKSAQSGSAFGCSELVMCPGPDSLSPENLCSVSRADNGEPLEDNENDVFALLVAESTVANGNSFDDNSGGNRVKLCLVTENFSTKTLQAANPANVGGQTITYRYIIRRPFKSLPPGSLTSRGIFRQMVGNVDITESRAVANQAGNPVPVPASLLYQLAAGTAFKVQSTNGTTDLFGITNASTGVAAVLNVGSLAVNTTSPSTFSQGITAAGGAGAVNVAVTASQVDAAGLILKSTGSGALALQSGGPVTFKDGLIATSNWVSTSVQLAASAADYNNVKTLFGETSLLGMIVAASTHANHRNVPAVVQGGIIPAGTLMTGQGSTPNLQVLVSGSTTFPDYSKVYRQGEDVKIKRNGVELLYGANQAAGADWYPGGDPTKGEFYINIPLFGTTTGHADVITMEVIGAASQ